LPWWGMEGFSSFKTWRNQIHMLQVHLMKFAAAVDSAKKIGRSLQGTGLEAMMPEVKPLLAVTTPKKLHPEIRELFSNLETNTFKGKPSFFSHFGRIAATNKILLEARDHLLPFVEAIGYLDAAMSIVRLMKEHEDKNVHYCFVNFVEHDRPVIDFEQAWNPCVAVDKVVANDIRFGGTNAQHAMITGANTSGKTTILRTTGVAGLMALAFGVAPATKATMTPFAQIVTYMKVNDNLGEGLSGYAASLKQMDTIVRYAEQEKRGFVLLLVDEGVAGTAPEVLVRNNLDYVEKLLKLPHVMLLQTTHLEKLTKLQERLKLPANSIQDCKVDVIIKTLPSGKKVLIRTYKMTLGIDVANTQASDIVALESVEKSQAASQEQAAPEQKNS
jgi:hypothetical protein